MNSFNKNKKNKKILNKKGTSNVRHFGFLSTSNELFV